MPVLQKLSRQLPVCVLIMAGLVFLLGALPAEAQQTTGVSGSPSATTTIDGRYLPTIVLPFLGSQVGAESARR